MSFCRGFVSPLMAFHQGQCCGAHTSGLIKRFISQSENIHILESSFYAQGSARENIKGFKLQAWKAWEMSFQKERHCWSLQEERSLSLTLRYSEPPVKPAYPAGCRRRRGAQEELKQSCLFVFYHPLCTWIKLHNWFLHLILTCTSIKSVSPELLDMNKCFFQLRWICIKANSL